MQRPRVLYPIKNSENELRKIIAKQLALLAEEDQNGRGKSQTTFMRFVANVCSQSGRSNCRSRIYLRLYLYDVLAEIGKNVVKNFKDAEVFVNALRVQKSK